LAEQFPQAYHVAGDAHLEPSTLLNTLRTLLEPYCEWYDAHEITEMPKGFDWIFDCRGLGAKPNHPGLRGVRGEIIHVHAPMITLHHLVRLLHPRYPIYCVPYRDHVFAVGGTTIEAEDYSPISVNSCLELLTGLMTLHPAFAEARIIRTLTHCRPAFVDNRPQIIHQQNTTAILGCYRSGYLLGPALIEQALKESIHG
jgi:glycine oxidase